MTEILDGQDKTKEMSRKTEENREGRFGGKKKGRSERKEEERRANGKE